VSDSQNSEPRQTELQQTELLAVPGWGTPFPPEQPRRDADEPERPDGMPTAASVAAASAIGEEADADFSNEDRRPFDRRRRRARAIDSMILLPAALLVIHLTKGVTVAAGAMVLAIDLSYFFLLEAIQGQTLGKKFTKLRVMHPDGSAPSASRIALRTIVRPLDYTFVGLLTVLSTGKRRQRIGDLLANTIVRDDNRGFKRAPESPLLVVFPLAVIGLAVAAMIAFKPVDPMLAKRNPHPYMAKIDKICEKRIRQAGALDTSGQLTFTSGRLLLRQETRKIEKMPAPPPELKGDVKDVVTQHRKVDRVLDRMSRDIARSPDPTVAFEQNVPAADSVIGVAKQRYAELGLPYCAR
jgi:hypothetical protein